MATERLIGNKIELRAYAGTDPATGKRQSVYDYVPADVGKRELDRKKKALDARAQDLQAARRDRRRNPGAAPRKKPVRADKTIRDAVEAWWAAHGSKLANAPKRRPLIDGIILPHLGDIRLTVLSSTGTPPDDPDEREPDLVYLSEKWEEIQKKARKSGDEPLEASTIQTCHTSILGPALRRAGHPVTDPGLPKGQASAETTPLPEEMTAFLPYLGAGRQVGGYTSTRRVRGSDRVITYTVPARQGEPSLVDRMLEPFAFLVANGPRPVEAAAITRTQLDLDRGELELRGDGVVLVEDDNGAEEWVVVHGETPKRRRRRITLDGRCVDALRRWLTIQDEFALRFGERLGPRALVFSLDPAGKEPASPKVLSKAFERAVDSARAAEESLPEGFHLYDMRHFGITHMLRLGAGRNVAAVAARFGTSTRMIEQRYEHAIPKDDRALADALTGVWGAAGPDGEADVVRLDRAH